MWESARIVLLDNQPVIFVSPSHTTGSFKMDVVLLTSLSICNMNINVDSSCNIDRSFNVDSSCNVDNSYNVDSFCNEYSLLNIFPSNIFVFSSVEHPSVNTSSSFIHRNNLQAL